MIAPCLCKGTQKFVHRECLDRWRATKNALNNCDVCHFEYEVEVQGGEVADAERLLKYRLLVARDLFGYLLLSQVAVGLVALFLYAVDGSKSIAASIPSASAGGVYYLYGLITLLAVIGFLGCMFVTTNGAHQHGGCHGIYCFSCPDCRADNDGCAALLAFVVVIFAVMGIFIVLAKGYELVSGVLRKHMNVLWLRGEAQKYRVVDFNGREDELERRHNANRGEAVEEIAIDVRLSALPAPAAAVSAPAPLAPPSPLLEPLAPKAAAPGPSFAASTVAFAPSAPPHPLDLGLTYQHAAPAPPGGHVE